MFCSDLGSAQRSVASLGAMLENLLHKMTQLNQTGNLALLTHVLDPSCGCGVICCCLLQNNMNQRGVTLVIEDDAEGKVTLRMPPDAYITHPGYHMLFLMNGDTPCTRAEWIKLFM